MNLTAVLARDDAQLCALAFQLLRIIVTAFDNISQNTFVEYLLANNCAAALFEVRVFYAGWLGALTLTGAVLPDFFGQAAARRARVRRAAAAGGPRQFSEIRGAQPVYPPARDLGRRCRSDGTASPCL